MSQLPDPQWNATDAVFPHNSCIPLLFEAQVSRTPDAVAIIDGDTSMTYAALNEQSNQIARVLIEAGVTRGSVVVCHLRRSSAVVVYTLAVMKAGGTYVLFDAGMPRPRMEYILNDAQPMLVLTDTELSDLPQNNGSLKLHVSEIERRAKAQAGSDLENKTESSDIAYVAYTSGSTGKPKGVMITHRATINHTISFSNLFQLTARDRMPVMAPIAFDMAMEEILPPLLSGCTLVVAKTRFVSMQDFHREVVAETYSILNIPAPLWQEWTDYLVATHTVLPESLRLVIVGSEEVLTQALQTWKQLPGATRIRWVAAYGTTETTITSTYYMSGMTDELQGELVVPIGKPIANTYLYILDDQLKPVVVGEEGELYIGGEGLAAGYLHREDLTHQSFVHDPFKGMPEARMYRTGDIAHYRPDGNVVWTGRKDTQMKRFGLRIEPAEIESTMLLAPFVEEAVVVLRKVGVREADKRLVVFVAAKPGMFFDEKQLRALAIRHLPGLMVPDSYIYLPDLPLNSNGKIDRRALERWPI